MLIARTYESERPRGDGWRTYEREPSLIAEPFQDLLPGLVAHLEGIDFFGAVRRFGLLRRSRRPIVNDDPLVRTARRQQLAVRAERDAGYLVGVAFQGQ